MIKIGDNFDYRGPLPNFARDAFSNLQSAPTTGIDIGHISYCTGNGKYYKFTSTGWKEVIDSALNDTSENPVQNKIINTALKEKVNKIPGTPTLGNFIVIGEDGTKLVDSGKKPSDYAKSSYYFDIVDKNGGGYELDQGITWDSIKSKYTDGNTVIAKYSNNSNIYFLNLSSYNSDGSFTFLGRMNNVSELYLLTISSASTVTRTKLL